MDQVDDMGYHQRILLLSNIKNISIFILHDCGDGTRLNLSSLPIDILNKLLEICRAITMQCHTQVVA